MIDAQGDAVFATFPTARDGVHAALAAQRSLQADEWPGRVRMGLHTGASEEVGERQFGIGVHRAARICALAAGGEILCSHTTHDLVADEQDDLLGEIDFIDIGEHELKGLDRPVRLYRID